MVSKLSRWNDFDKLGKFPNNPRRRQSEHQGTTTKLKRGKRGDKIFGSGTHIQRLVAAIINKCETEGNREGINFFY